MEITTNRFLLRDFVPEDEPALLAYRADPRYAEFCASDEVTPDFTHELLQRFMQWTTEVPRRNYQFAMLRFSKWKQNILTTPEWQIPLGIAWMFFPLVVLLAMP